MMNSHTSLVVVAQSFKNRPAASPSAVALPVVT